MVTLTLFTIVYPHFAQGFAAPCGGCLPGLPGKMACSRGFRYRTPPFAELFSAVFSFGVEFVAELPIQRGCSAPGFGPAPPICTLYYNINTVREKVVFLKFRQICQKLRAKNSSYGKNRCFFLQSSGEHIIILTLCEGHAGVYWIVSYFGKLNKFMHSCG
mgnify:CR=1 FL=1